MEKIKSFFIGFFIFLINTALVVVGVFYIKNQQQKKINDQKIASDLEYENKQKLIDEKLQELQYIIENNKNAKIKDLSDNTGSVNIQKPTTVTEIKPAVTSTIKVPVPNKTTKKS